MYENNEPELEPVSGPWSTAKLTSGLEELHISSERPGHSGKSLKGIIFGISAGVAAVVLPVLIFTTLGSISRPPASSISTLTAHEKMRIAFQGNHSIDEVKVATNKLLQTFGMETNEDNLQKLGDVLVALRKNFHHSEFELMRCMGSMRQSTSRSINLTIWDAAAECGAMSVNF